MKIITPPNYIIKSRESLERYGLEICGEITEENAVATGKNISNYFGLFKGDFQQDVLEAGRFFGALGFVFARCVEMVSDWRLVWINLSENDATDGVDSLVNKDKSLLVYPLGIVRSDYLKKTNVAAAFFDFLESGDSISDSPNSFTEWKPPSAP